MTHENNLFTTVKQAAKGRGGEIITALTPLPLEVLKKGSADHPCPICHGQSVIFPDTRDGGVNDHGRLTCRKCTKGKPTGDVIATVAAFNGIRQGESAKRIAEFLGLSSSVPANGKSKRAPEDIVAAVARDKQMPLDAFKQFEPISTTRGRRKMPVARVSVYNEAGEKHSHFDFAPGQKGWFARGQGMSGMFFPGKLPQAEETWCLVEGCKDAAALIGLGYNAAGMPGSQLPERYCRLFQGAHVILVPDLDTAGQLGAQKTGGRLSGIAASVRIARLPGKILEKGGDDVRDVLRRVRT